MTQTFSQWTNSLSQFFLSAEGFSKLTNFNSDGSLLGVGDGDGEGDGVGVGLKTSIDGGAGIDEELVSSSVFILFNLNCSLTSLNDILFCCDSFCEVSSMDL